MSHGHVIMYSHIAFVSDSFIHCLQSKAVLQKKKKEEITMSLKIIQLCFTMYIDTQKLNYETRCHIVSVRSKPPLLKEDEFPDLSVLHNFITTLLL